MKSKPLNKNQIIYNIRNYATYMQLYRNTLSDTYLATAIKIYEEIILQLSKYDVLLKKLKEKRLHRTNRRRWLNVKR